MNRPISEATLDELGLLATYSRTLSGEGIRTSREFWNQDLAPNTALVARVVSEASEPARRVLKRVGRELRAAAAGHGREHIETTESEMNLLSEVLTMVMAEVMVVDIPPEARGECEAWAYEVLARIT
jgi:hypothetical protein